MIGTMIARKSRGEPCRACGVARRSIRTIGRVAGSRISGWRQGGRNAGQSSLKSPKCSRSQAYSHYSWLHPGEPRSATEGTITLN